MSKRPASLEDAERQAQRIGQSVGKQMPLGWGFFLCLAQIGEAGSMTYVSSLHRSAMPKFCRELATRLETGEGSLDVKGNEDPDMDRALNIITLLGSVLSGGTFQLGVTTDPKLIAAYGGKKEFMKMVKQTERALQYALRSGGELVRRLNPEMIDGE